MIEGDSLATFSNVLPYSQEWVVRNRRKSSSELHSVADLNRSFVIMRDLFILNSPSKYPFEELNKEDCNICQVCFPTLPW